MLLEFLLLSALALYLFYRWATAHNSFFKDRGLPYDKPFPLLGSMKDVILRKQSFPGMVDKLYNAHDGKVYGIFDQRLPLFLIRDPELIKQITIKDFDHFMNHRNFFKEDNNLFSRSIFVMRDNTWKDMRSTLSPAFTGSKMRQMFQLINQVAEETAAHVKKQVDKESKSGVELELKDFATRFTNDVIASTAFGLQVNSFENRENEFYRTGKRVTSLTKWQNIKFFLFANFHYIMKILKFELLDKESCDYFMRLVLDAMNYRKENNITRPDMINMMMEARGMIKSDQVKSHHREWSDIDIVAQCFIFFFAGFETSSVLLCFAAHELMENPDIQQKLYEEIAEVNESLDGKPLGYEALLNMKYMDMVVNEALRKWPAAISLDRVCNEDFVYESDGERFEIKKGENVWIPVWGLHHDEKYFENPNKFDPERFSEENKDKIQPCTFLPFGVGPRNCIGSRFALMEAKALLFYLIRDFNIVAGKKTDIPLQLMPSSFQLTAKNGFWLKFVPRTKA